MQSSSLASRYTKTIERKEFLLRVRDNFFLEIKRVGQELFFWVTILRVGSIGAGLFIFEFESIKNVFLGIGTLVMVFIIGSYFTLLPMVIVWLLIALLFNEASKKIVIPFTGLAFIVSFFLTILI